MWYFMITEEQLYHGLRNHDRVEVDTNSLLWHCIRTYTQKQNMPTLRLPSTVRRQLSTPSDPFSCQVHCYWETCQDLQDAIRDGRRNTQSVFSHIQHWFNMKVSLNHLRIVSKHHICRFAALNYVRIIRHTWQCYKYQKIEPLFTMSLH